MLGIGLQNKSLEVLADEFNMPINQILAKFYDCMKKLTKKCLAVTEANVERTMRRTSDLNTGSTLMPTQQTFNEELDEAAKVCAQLLSCFCFLFICAFCLT